MVFSNVDLSVSVAATQQSCRDALALYGVTPGGGDGPAFSEFLEPRQRQEITAACYELFLVWAEALAPSPVPGRPPPPVQLAEAIQLLDRAAQLGLPLTPAYYQRRAGYLERQGQAGAALEERQRAAAAGPQGALDYFLAGVSHQKQEHLAAAVQDFKKVLGIQAGHFWAQYFLAVCDLQLGHPDRAWDNLTACMATQPDLAWLYLFRGIANDQLHKFGAAEEDYQRALALQPDADTHHGIVMNQGIHCLRQARLVAGLVPLPWPVPQTPNLELVGRGVAEVYRQKRLAAATVYLQEAIRLRPQHYAAYRDLALVAIYQKRLDEALQRLGTAIQRLDENQTPAVRAQLHGLRARVYRDQHRIEKALDDLDVALKLLPSAADHVERGRLLYVLRKYPDAVAAFDAALRLRPEEAEGYRLKAEALLAMHRDPEAAAALDQYQANGGRPTAAVYRTRGLIRAKLHQFPQALADYTQALALQPDSATHAARGWVFLANEVTPLALRDFEEAIRLDPANAEAYAGRGLIRARRGQPAQALADAEAALVHGRPETPRLLWNIAHVHAQLVSVLAADAATHNGWARVTRARCLEDGIDLLRRALEPMSAPERVDFWRQYIAPDLLLNPLRGSPGFDRLERRFSK